MHRRRLSGNGGITGTIPSGIGSLPSLGTLWLHDTALSGAVPAGLGALSNMTDLRLDNTQLATFESGFCPAVWNVDRKSVV